MHGLRCWGRELVSSFAWDIVRCFQTLCFESKGLFASENGKDECEPNQARCIRNKLQTSLCDQNQIWAQGRDLIRIRQERSAHEDARAVMR
jgi:hypothetical protein